MMRVGMVTGEYPPMEGGVGAYTREVARAMVELDSELHILTRQTARGSSETGIHVTAAIGKRWGWGTLGAIRDWAREHQLDIVNVQFQTAAYDMHPAIHWLPAALQGKHLTVVTFHDLRAPYLFPKAGPMRAWVVQKLARDADATIATDRMDEAKLRHWGVKRVRWIPIGSNVKNQPPAEFDRQAWRARLGVELDTLLISYFGFLNESKGGLVLIDALARLVEQSVPAHLVMIGGRAGASDPTNFAYGERVDEHIAQHGLAGRVRWTGFVTDEEVSAYFLASDMTALPYLDGVSLRRGTLMAALVHGQAIVTTKPQAHIPELEDTVVTVPVGDADALAEAILVLWQNPGRRETLEKRALAAAQLFGWEGIARQTLELFDELLS